MALQTDAISWKKEMSKPKQDLPVTVPAAGTAEQPPAGVQADGSILIQVVV